MLKNFIDRPVLSTVISVIIVILGILGLYTLPISQYPDIAPPTVEVTTSYQGANADVVRKSVLIPLEEQINGVENMQYMTSTAGNDGSAAITIYFKLGTDPDLAVMNVQNRVNKASNLLPEEVIRSGVSTGKVQSSLVYIFSIYSTKDSYDQNFLQNYVSLNILPKLKRVNGIGDAFIYGARDYAMRIWLKPDAMASYGLVPADVIGKLRQQNIEAAPGKFGVNGDQAFQYTIKYKGRLQTAEEFGEIVIKAGKDGEMLRLDDVAKVELGALDYNSSTKTLGYPSTSIAISQSAGSNAYELINECQRIVEESAKDFPSGIDYVPFLNANEFLNASIDKVIHTLIEAFILVFIVVFIFLQDFRSTLIPAISVPVAIIGTFFFLQLFGFTINLLTLFALVLAIGIVVDDAIVVVEAVHAKFDQGSKTAKKATLHAMSEISKAIVSITLVMAAVFVPVSFIGGSTGVFYKQFGLTLAIAIVISAINALTLSPALCALFLKVHDHDVEDAPKGFLKRFYAKFNVAFQAVTFKYIKGVQFLLRRKWLAIGLIVGFSALAWGLIKNTPTGFVPSEDSRAIFGNIILPPSSSLERTTELADKVDSIIQTVPEVESLTRMAGRDIISGTGGSYGAFFIRLKSWDDRQGEGQDIESVVNKLFYKTSGIKGANIIFFAAPTLQGFGSTNGFEFNLQDRTANDMDKFNGVVGNYMGAINQRPEILYATTSFSNSFPQYELEVDVAKCEMAGITPDQVLAVMQGYYGGIYASDFNRFNKQYRVMVQSEPGPRAKPEDLHSILVRTGNGEMVPITQFVSLKKIFGPEFIKRFNLFTSANVTGVPAPGYSSGDAVKAIQEVAEENLTKQYGYEFAGLSREEVNSGNQTVYIFILCLVFVYFLLAAQYESYILPFSILLPLPIGLAGAYLFAKLFGIDNNIFLQISLIMLTGLLAKNSILIVEFALMHRKSGLSLASSVVRAAKARLRPILMTSFAFIFGLLPLMFASGAGAVSNRSIGTAAVGGMLVGTLCGVFVIPALFVMFQALQERLSLRLHKEEDHDHE